MTNLDRQSTEALGRLHGETLPDSLVSALGPTGLRLYYRFVAHSPEELLLTTKSGKDLAAACVFSFAPETLMSRFLAAHPFAIAALMLLHLPTSRRLRRFVRAKVMMNSPADAAIESGLPEVVQIFVASGSQRQGLGAKLLERLDAQLKQLGIRRYAVKTEDRLDNLALEFYRKNDYSEAGRLDNAGKSYVCFHKRLDD